MLSRKGMPMETLVIILFAIIAVSLFVYFVVRLF